MQNQYNLAHREDDALIDDLAARRHRLCAVLPARRLHAAAVDDAVRCRRAARRDADAGGARLAAARSPNILLIPGTSSLEHLRENLAAASLKLPDDALPRWTVSRKTPRGRDARRPFSPG